MDYTQTLESIMKRLDEKEITKIEQFMEDKAFDSVDFMLASFGMVAMRLAITLEFVQKWSYDGALQTFDSRKLFRKEAEELLNV